MPNPIRILHLEDCVRDAEIIKDLIEGEGGRYEITCASTRKEYESALSDPGYTLIICDFKLPDFDGLSALKLGREKFPETPVVIISGVINPEEAVECLKAGATDYLLKQGLERLPSAIKRALEEVEEHRQRRQAEMKLRESEERFRQLAENSSEGIWFLELNPERILYVNPVVEKIWGLPPERFYQDARTRILGIHPDDQPRVCAAWEALLSGQSEQFEEDYRVVRPDGSIRWVLDGGIPIRNDTGEIIRVSGVSRDMTERKKMENQLFHTQRLEAIGTLAAGVAHDLNNALAPIMMGTELLRIQYPNESSIVDMLEASARRSADMVQQLLSFARGAEGERIVIQPRQVVRELEKLMEGSFPKNIMVIVKCAPQLPMVLGDATQLSQVLLNLCVNARDAMPQGGTLTLEAKDQEVDADCAGFIPKAKPGRYVMLQVSDTGTGISPENIDKIFDPFFTTKSPDKGTGLGLATVMGIVKGHGGFLKVCSQPGEGSAFTVYLPVNLTGGTPELEARTVVKFRGQGETILLVDDEAAVCTVGRAVLERLNFKVLTAKDGKDGLMKVAQHHAEIRAIITDLNMPHMDGLTFARSVRQMLADIPIIVASGRMEETVAGEFKTLGVTQRLNKPFSEAQLLRVLQTFLTKG